MSTFPRGRRARLGFESFVEITDVEVVSITKDAVTFAADLSEDEAADVVALLDSLDDADMAARANLRTLLAAAETGDLDDIRALTVAAMRYWLGETP